MITYKYFISFVAKVEDNVGLHHGNAIIETKYKFEDIEGLEDIKEVEKAICKQHNLQAISITNFIFLREVINEDLLEKACEAVVNAENDGDHIPAID